MLPLQRLYRALAVLAIALATTLPAAVAHAQEDPRFPPLTGRVIDAANLLDESTERALGDSLAAHEQASSDQVVVATVPSLDGYAIADYANRLGRAWGIGTAENDNGVLLLVAPNEREVRIEVGYGLEGALTDALSSTIIRREILPAFRSGDYAGGIETGVASILAAIEGEYTAPPPGEAGSGGGASRAIDQFVPLIFIALIAIPQLLRRGGARRAANGAFPAGFAGLVGALISGSAVIGIVVAIALFALIWFGGKGGGGKGGGRRSSRRRRTPGVIVGGGGFGGGLGGGGFGGGGFGGGGGSFGGGGASGGW